MEKIEVRSWEDLSVYIISGSDYRYILSWNLIDIEIRKTDLESAVKILNALGQTLEYKKIEVIDTLEKWEEFQEILSKNNFFYDRTNKEFLELESNDEDLLIGVLDKNLDPTYIERKFNVNLKILKEKK